MARKPIKRAIVLHIFGDVGRDLGTSGDSAGVSLRSLDVGVDKTCRVCVNSLRRSVTARDRAARWLL